MAIIISGAAATEAGISVEMADVKVTSRLTERLVAYGLGACIGLCVYDPILRIGGMAHIVLPERQKTAMTKQNDRPEHSPGKFADTGVPFLVEEVCKYGATRQNLRAAMAGGSHIFGTATEGAASRLEIGARNARAIFVALERLTIPILAADVGGSHGRTVTLRMSDGAIFVQPIGGAEKLLTTLGREERTREKCA